MTWDAIPSVGVGILLQIIAAGLAGREWFVWKTEAYHLPTDDPQRLVAQRRLQRRLRVSLIMALIGVMIPLGDVIPIFRNSPQLWVIHWLSVLGFVVLIVLLALGDLAASLAANKQAQINLQQERLELETELRQHQNQHAQNGQANPPTN